mmetsp:Transcript_10482/g.16743  ORF Transcript_10482/g.16743 Transcript_10482/m.16743 type:complete len:228 (+) Transcript_10482:239-922(+)
MTWTRRRSLSPGSDGSGVASKRTERCGRSSSPRGRSSSASEACRRKTKRRGWQRIHGRTIPRNAKRWASCRSIITKAPFSKKGRTISLAPLDHTKSTNAISPKPRARTVWTNHRSPRQCNCGRGSSARWVKPSGRTYRQRTPRSSKTTRGWTRKARRWTSTRRRWQETNSRSRSPNTSNERERLHVPFRIQKMEKRGNIRPRAAEHLRTMGGGELVRRIASSTWRSV